MKNIIKSGISGIIVALIASPIQIFLIGANVKFSVLFILFEVIATGIMTLASAKISTVVSLAYAVTASAVLWGYNVIYGPEIMQRSNIMLMLLIYFPLVASLLGLVTNILPIERNEKKVRA